MEADRSVRRIVRNGFNCILRFSMEEFVTPKLPDSVLQPVWDAYADESVRRFVESPLRVPCTQQEWDECTDPVDCKTIRIDAVTDQTYLTRAKWGDALLRVDESDVSPLAEFAKLARTYTCLRFLAPEYYPWPIMIRMMESSRLARVMERFRAQAPDRFVAVWQTIPLPDEL